MFYKRTCRCQQQVIQLHNTGDARLSYCALFEIGCQQNRQNKTKRFQDHNGQYFKWDKNTFLERCLCNISNKSNYVLLMNQMTGQVADSIMIKQKNTVSKEFN